MANKPTAQTFSNDVSLLWLLKNSRTVYRSVLAQAEADKSDSGLSTTQSSLSMWSSLMDTIIANADSVQQSFTKLDKELVDTYVATSNFGTLAQEAIGTYISTAKNDAQFNTLITEITGTQINGIDVKFSELINGQIIRGFVQNPDYGVVPDAKQWLYGIVISSQVRTKEGSGQINPDDKETYYEIDTISMPTFGFYTSEGWQFWVGGNRVGWYNSQDGRLHTDKQEVTTDIIMRNWLMTDESGFGIKYLGG